MIVSYRDLDVWKKAISLAELCYRFTSAFPRDEMYGMTSQIRRAAVSVAANIAEGHGRESTGSFVQFLRQSQGSLKELETHLLIVERVGLETSERTQALLCDCEAIGKMLRALIRSLQRRQAGNDDSAL